jgi:hypothetical protein
MHCWRAKGGAAGLGAQPRHGARADPALRARASKRGKGGDWIRAWLRSRREVGGAAWEPKKQESLQTFTFCTAALRGGGEVRVEAATSSGRASAGESTGVATRPPFFLRDCCCAQVRAKFPGRNGAIRGPILLKSCWHQGRFTLEGAVFRIATRPAKAQLGRSLYDANRPSPHGVPC